MKAGHLDAACNLFLDSLKLERTAGTAINIGQCEEARGRLAHVLFAFRDAQEGLAPGDERRDYVAARIKALGKTVPRVIIQKPSVAATSLAVWIDGEPLPESAFGVEVPVDEGVHVLGVQAQGRTISHAEYTLRIGERHTRVLTLGPASAAVAPSAASIAATPPPKAPSRGSTTLSYSLFATSGALLAGGALSGIFLLDAAATFRNNCDAATRVCANTEGERARSRANTLQWLTPILLGTGVAAGVTAVLVWPSKASRTSSSLWVDPSHASAGIRGTF